MTSLRSYGQRFVSEAKTYRVAGAVTSTAIENFLCALDCPRSLAVWIMFREKEHAQIAALKCSPDHYDNPQGFADAYAATKFLSKYKDLELTVDRKVAALEKFSLFEKACASTNARFRSTNMFRNQPGHIVWLHNAVKRKISGILGEFRPEEFFDFAGWGPGSSTVLPVDRACAANKYQEELGITRDLKAFVIDGPRNLLAECYPAWWGHLSSKTLKLEVGNKVTTVPKDAEIDRVIAIEPGINLWFQKAVGRMIRLRLRRCGVDLRKQANNQQLCKVASITGHLATVDFKSASDSIALELVRELIPPTWFEVMDVCRSHYGSVGSSCTRWEKFSSMGNGFTFELESLIFFAMAEACCCYLGIESEVGVYGDDVIIPVSCRTIFSDLSEFYGFTWNPTKSFFNGPFRESCGVHFWSGVDVKPIYLKSRLSNTLSVYRLGNAVRRYAHARALLYGCDARFRKTFVSLLRSVPRSLRLRIPDDRGDGGFIANFDEAVPIKHRTGGPLRGYRFYSLLEESVPLPFDGIGLLLASLPVASIDVSQIDRTEKSSLTNPDGDRVTPRWIARLLNASFSHGNTVAVRDVKRLKLSKLFVQQWYDLGPWF